MKATCLLFDRAKCETQATDVLYLYFHKALPPVSYKILIRKLGKYSVDEIPYGEYTAGWETAHKSTGMSKQYRTKTSMIIQGHRDRTVTHKAHEITLLLFSVEKGLSYNTGLVSRQRASKTAQTKWSEPKGPQQNTEPQTILKRAERDLKRQNQPPMCHST